MTQIVDLDTVSDAITQAFLFGQGKPVPPASGTPKYNQLLLIAKAMQTQWANEPGVEWESLCDDVTLSSGISSGNVVALDASIRTIRKGSDDPILVNGNAYKLVSASKLYRYKDSQVVAKKGRTLQFASGTDLTGGTVVVPAVLYPNKIVDATSPIAVDDPWWLVYMMAAEFARNNIIKTTQYDNLLAYAENSMTAMKEDNVSSIDEVETVGFVTGESW